MKAAATLRRAIGLLVLLATHASAQAASSTITGTVTADGPDGARFVLPGVTLTLTCTGGDPRIEVSGGQGDFRFADVTTTGSCSLSAVLAGFKTATRAVEVKAGETTTVEMQLALETVREDVTVHAGPAASSENPAGARIERITSSILQTAPSAAARFQDALPLIPGVVRGPDGLLNVNGSRTNQTALTFNSADGTDPVTGEDAIELPIDAVSSVRVRGGAYAPEFGLSAGGATTIETQSAGDRWDVTVNDLEPRVRRRGGEFRGLESWTPRITVGGPLIKGKLSLLESVQYEYSQTRVFGLPPLESDTKVEGLASFTRADWKTNRTDRVTMSAMVSPRRTTYAGLNTFNPQSVTPVVENHSTLASASDQIVREKGVFETRLSLKRFDATIWPSQGRGPMILAPDQNSGSYFNDQDRTSRRAEWFNTYSFTPLGPTHLVKIGGGVTYETFDGVHRSRPVHIVREDGSLSQEITFTGSGLLDRTKTAYRVYAQDAWTVAPRLTVQYGVRYDYESLTGDGNLAPRGAFSLLASADGRTVVRGGAGLFYSAVPLNVATFDRQQRRVVTAYAEDGRTPLGPSIEWPNLVASPLRAPRSVTWEVEVDREWLKNLFVRVGYQQRENRRESIVDAAETAIILRTVGRSRYRQGQISARYAFRRDDQIVASFTRSSATGSLNDFNGFFGNIENPVIRPDERGPLPWDAPDRFLIWGSISLPRGFAVFPVLDARTGFPLSNVDADRNFVGPRNGAGRYPPFLSLDAQMTKRLRVFGHKATIGLKVFNITDHFNPRDYQGNLASRNFGSFDNSVGRTFRGKWIFEF